MKRPRSAKLGALAKRLLSGSAALLALVALRFFAPGMVGCMDDDDECAGLGTVFVAGGAGKEALPCRLLVLFSRRSISESMAM